MMWFVIVTLIVIAAILIFNMYQNKYQSAQGTIFNVVVTCFVLFLALSMGYVYFKGDVSVRSFNEVVVFGKLYFSWLGHFFGNIKGITGYVIKMDWAGNVTRVK